MSLKWFYNKALKFKISSMTVRVWVASGCREKKAGEASGSAYGVSNALNKSYMGELTFSSTKVHAGG